MIKLINGYPQGPTGLIVPNGSIRFQLNTDATIIAAPYGFVFAANPVTFQFNAAGQIQPNTGAYAQIWSNQELNPQNTFGLGTYYLVTFYDQNGALLNTTPLWWQFPETIGTTVDISNMTAIATIGGNIIFYPTNFLGGTGTVTSVAFVGDGTILSATPSTAVTTSGNITATLLTQSANTALLGPTSGPASLPTWRTITLADLPATVNIWSSLAAPIADLILATTTFNTTFTATTPTTWTWSNLTAATSLTNQNSPILKLAGSVWTGSASTPDFWTIQNVVTAGALQGQTLTITPNLSKGAVLINATLACGQINSGAIFASSITLPAPVATSGGNGSSDILNFNGSWWNGSAAVTSSTNFQEVVGFGINPSESLVISNSGAYTWGGVSIVGALAVSGTINSLTVPSAAGSATFTQTISSGTQALGTTLIASGAASSVISVAVTGVLATDNLLADFNTDPSGITGYAPSASGMLTIIKWCSSGHINFYQYNNTGAGITPGAVTLNWRVVR